MRGLTPAEAALLREAAEPFCCTHRMPTDAERATFADLIEQGRVRLQGFQCDHGEGRYYQTAAAGREILRLWPSIQEALRGAR